MTDATLSPRSLTAPVPLVRDLIRWIALRPRTYRETMDAWRTSCPRLPVWEDAIDGGFVVIAREEEADHHELRVIVTPEGRAFLEAETRPGDAEEPGRR